MTKAGDSDYILVEKTVREKDTFRKNCLCLIATDS